jgi:hypothetical protein
MSKPTKRQLQSCEDRLIAELSVTSPPDPYFRWCIQEPILWSKPEDIDMLTCTSYKTANVVDLLKFFSERTKELKKDVKRLEGIRTRYHEDGQRKAFQLDMLRTELQELKAEPKVKSKTVTEVIEYV